MTQPKDIEGLRKVAEEATPGPWEVWPYGDPRVVNSEIGWTIYTNEDPDEAQRPQLDANARYIATFDPPTVLALLSELEAVKGELRWIAIFAAVRSADDRKTFARVSRDALRNIASRAEAALVSLKGGGGSSCTNLDSSPVGATDSACQSEGGEP